MGNLFKNGKGFYARIAGKQRWICSVKGHTEADAEVIFHRKAEALLTGKNPVPVPAKIDKVATIHYLLGRWLLDREADAQAKTLSASAFTAYRRSGKRIDAIAGHYAASEYTPDITRHIFTVIKNNDGSDAARRAISHLRQALRYAEEMRWCDPVRLGRQATKFAASKSTGMKWKLYEPTQIQLVLGEINRRIADADGRSLPSWKQFKAMFFLALNGGYGAKELADLPREVVDLPNALIDYRRGKTGEDHIVPLWTETVEALVDVLAERRGDELVFRTRQGNPWCMCEFKMKNGKPGKRSTDHVNERFKEVVAELGIRIKGQGFYKLKHLHATIADRAGDVHATFVLRGHGIPGASKHYVHVGQDRLRNVVNFIHDYLFNPAKDPASAS